jgi:hypothetical protein
MLWMSRSGEIHAAPVTRCSRTAAVLFIELKRRCGKLDIGINRLLAELIRCIYSCAQKRAADDRSGKHRTSDP